VGPRLLGAAPAAAPATAAGARATRSGPRDAHATGAGRALYAQRSSRTAHPADAAREAPGTRDDPSSRPHDCVLVSGARPRVAQALTSHANPRAVAQPRATPRLLARARSATPRWLRRCCARTPRPRCRLPAAPQQPLAQPQPRVSPLRRCLPVRALLCERLRPLRPTNPRAAARSLVTSARAALPAPAAAPRAAGSPRAATSGARRGGGDKAQAASNAVAEAQDPFSSITDQCAPRLAKPKAVSASYSPFLPRIPTRPVTATETVSYSLVIVAGLAVAAAAAWAVFKGASSC
jgi:hypothetical protein